MLTPLEILKGDWTELTLDKEPPQTAEEIFVWVPQTEKEIVGTLTAVCHENKVYVAYRDQHECLLQLWQVAWRGGQ